MNERNPSDKPQAEPWHAADEKKPAGPKRGGGPIGTHSLTGGSAEVGLPSSPQADGGIERGESRDERENRAGDELMKEPRAGLGGILGRKP